MKKRNMVLVTSMLLVVLLIAGGTFAWFTAETKAVDNNFKAGTVRLGMQDWFWTCGAQNVNPGDCIYKQVYICNYGTKRSVYRIKLDTVWEGNLTGTGVVDYNLNTPHWYDGGDGYAYYKHVVPAGWYTHSLFKNDKVCFSGPNMNNSYMGKKLKMTLKAEAIQATNGAPQLAWGPGAPVGVPTGTSMMKGQTEAITEALEKAPEQDQELIKELELQEVLSPETVLEP